MARKTTIRISSSQSAVRVPRKRIAELIGFVGAREGVHLGEIDLAFVEAGQIASLNRAYLGRRGATDVLSFDLSDSRTPGISAQIVVCGDLAADRAAAEGTGLQRELMLYVVHGLLHLTGYDDGSVRAAASMHARGEQLLDAFYESGKR